MGINRRNFFKAIGLTGAALAAGKPVNASSSEKNDVEFYGVLYDSTLCVACQQCEHSCAEINSLPEPEGAPEAGIVRKTSDRAATVVNFYNTSKGEVPVKKQCMHCNEPACGTACLTKAMYKTKEGPAIWREDKCMGCRYCMISCPFDIPKFQYQSTYPKIIKCTMCYDKIKDGGIPECVENCPAEALVFGTRKELLMEAKRRILEEPDRYYDHVYGEYEAGGTGWLYLSPVPFEELGFNTGIQNSSYPALTKGFISSIAPVDILLPLLLLGIHEATKSVNNKNDRE